MSQQVGLKKRGGGYKNTGGKEINVKGEDSKGVHNEGREQKTARKGGERLGGE